MTIPSPPIRVHVVDDDGIVRPALVSRLKTAPGLVITGASSSAAEALDHLQTTDVDVVLMDIRMPKVDGIDAAHRIRALHPDVRVVFVTNAEDPDTQQRAMSAGASGYVLKSASTALMAQSLAAAYHGYVLYPPGYRPMTIADPPSMNDRQRAVLSYLLDGVTIDGIHKALFISPSTVKKDTEQLCDLFGVDNKSQLIAEAARRGITPHPEAERLARRVKQRRASRKT